MTAYVIKHANGMFWTGPQQNTWTASQADGFVFRFATIAALTLLTQTTTPADAFEVEPIYVEPAIPERAA